MEPMRPEEVRRIEETSKQSGRNVANDGGRVRFRFDGSHADGKWAGLRPILLKRLDGTAQKWHSF
jgi:phage/plasmid primase-like uncharacterized protein